MSIFKKHTLIRCIVAVTFCVLITPFYPQIKASCLYSIFGESYTSALLYGQGVANQRQSRAGHAEQGSVI